jgi:hypothetical protein
MGCQCIKRDPNDMIVLELNNNQGEDDIFHRKLTNNSRRERKLKVHSQDSQINSNNLSSINYASNNVKCNDAEEADRTGMNMYECNDLSLIKSMKSIFSLFIRI